MKKTPRISFIVLLMIFVSGALFNLTAESKKKDKPAKDRMRYYYDNKAVFEKLSGSAQSALIRAYGPKKGIGELGVPKDSPAAKALAPNVPIATIVNVPVNDPSLDLTAQNTQSETSIALAGSNIVVGYNDSGECIGGCVTDQHFTGFSYSTDGGASFIDGGALPDDPVTDVGDVGDPVLAYDSTNDILHLSTLGQDFLGAGAGNGPSLKCFRSTDGGVTWSVRVDCTPGFAATDFQDKQWMAVDNFPGPGQGNVYMAWRQFSASNPQGIRFVRSTDQGATWGPSPGFLIASQGTFNVQGAFVMVGPDHAIYVIWLDQSAGSGTAHILRGRKSTDQGVTWGAVQNLRTFVNTATNGNLNLNGGFRSSCFPHAVVVPAGANANSILITFNDNDAVNGDPDIFGLECPGGDLTACGSADQLNTEPANNEQFMPTLAVTPDGGSVLVTWYDRKNDPADMLIERFGKIFTGGVPTSEFVMSDNPFSPVFGADPVVNSVYMGDYDHAVADNNFFYASFLDTELGTQDVVFAKVPRNGPGTVLSRGAVTIDDSGGNNNGSVDFNECLTLNIALNNFGTSTATGVNATLSTSTPGVTITNAVSAYPNIAVGGTQTNNTPFQFETSPSFVCGTVIDFTLDVTTSSSTPEGGASFSFKFTVPSGTAGSAMQFDNNVVTPLVDAGSVNIPFNVAGFTGAIGNVIFSFHSTHTWDGDLDITLIAPDGTEVELTSDNGGANNNFGTSCGGRTVFDDTAATSITAGSAPFAGTFRPEQALAGFKGLSGTDVNGTWLLRITDDTAIDTGSFQCGSLFIAPAECTDGGGGCGAGCPNPPVITTTTLPNGTEGVGYNQTVQITGGTAPFNFTISAGSLPPGLSINNATGAITGTPDPGSAATYNFTVMVTDSVAGCEDTQALSITIDAPAACTYEDLFDDGTLTWLEEKPDVTETGGNLVLDPTGKKAIGMNDPVFAGISTGTILAEMQFASGGDPKAKSWLVTHRIDKRNLVEVQINVARGKIIVKHKINKVVVAKETGLFDFDFDTLYTITATYDGTDYVVSVNGTPVATMQPGASLVSAGYGFQSRGFVTMVNRTCVTP